MSFVHDDPEFEQLLRLAKTPGGRRLSEGLIEKDYWVTHTLWALHRQGFDVWFKGGTSLSKGFGLIERFSEDLDLKIDPGSVIGLPSVSSWKSDGTTATAERGRYFQELTRVIDVPGATATLDPDNDPSWHGANIWVTYPGLRLTELVPPNSTFVRLEIGNARVTPSVACAMTSFVHDAMGALVTAYEDNRPKAVRCVHPLVTLLEKLDALHRHVTNEKRDPATFVRHFEDAARIIQGHAALPPLEGYDAVRNLVDEMLTRPKQIQVMPSADDPAFTLAPGPRTDAIQKAHEAIHGMFWGARIPLANACETIRAWIAKTLG